MSLLITILIGSAVVTALSLSYAATTAGGFLNSGEDVLYLRSGDVVVNPPPRPPPDQRRKAWALDHATSLVAAQEAEVQARGRFLESTAPARARWDQALSQNRIQLNQASLAYQQELMDIASRLDAGTPEYTKAAEQARATLQSRMDLAAQTKDAARRTYEGETAKARIAIFQTLQEHGRLLHGAQVPLKERLLKESAP